MRRHTACIAVLVICFDYEFNGKASKKLPGPCFASHIIVLDLVDARTEKCQAQGGNIVNGRNSKGKVKAGCN